MAALPDLVLFAKYPLPGYAKTRLIPALGAQGAANVHRYLARRTVDTLLQSGAPVEVRYAGTDETAFRSWLGDGATFAKQVEGGLTERLIDAGRDHGHVFLGADTPDLQVAHVREAIAALETHDIVIGPAEDGGYYLIGMHQARPELLHNMPWSTAEVTPETLRRCKDLGLSVALLPVLADCDRPEDLQRWPELALLA
ncbi:TIGR04282 family arsenosugar biosynthesis glycosyltransferase [Blastomonas sp. AAP53]|uniref:TIGR04282 family arsenosugar biosynthesis glycosyltransferase n=1 Tax=Blastomonas sp. AAP53 TaxID=1248760 RepID=UPI00031137B9|nr:TIGR04282 family arsenosugar biosynthesis glycosyltransferase [Blastomonas sp. AAP53]